METNRNKTDRLLTVAQMQRKVENAKWGYGEALKQKDVRLEAAAVEDYRYWSKLLADLLHN